MRRGPTKNQLVGELAAIRKSCRMPLRRITERELERLRDDPNFIRAEQYGFCPVLDGEVGTHLGVRLFLGQMPRWNP